MDIIEITLLTTEEYEANKQLVKPLKRAWWLKSPGLNRFNATVVDEWGTANGYAHEGHGDVAGVRPVIKFVPESTELWLGDVIELAGENWRVIAEGVALCDRVLAEVPFRKEWNPETFNLYEKSDVKAWLDNWAKSHALGNKTNNPEKRFENRQSRKETKKKHKKANNIFIFLSLSSCGIRCGLSCDRPGEGE